MVAAAAGRCELKFEFHSVSFDMGKLAGRQNLLLIVDTMFHSQPMVASSCATLKA